MQICETCRHWEAADDYGAWDAFGVCRGVAFKERLAPAELLADMRAQVEKDPESTNAIYLRSRLSDLAPLEEQRAFTTDASGYMADLRTRADFGCVNHEPRD